MTLKPSHRTFLSPFRRVIMHARDNPRTYILLAILTQSSVYTEPAIDKLLPAIRNRLRFATIYKHYNYATPAFSARCVGSPVLPFGASERPPSGPGVSHSQTLVVSPEAVQLSASAASCGEAAMTAANTDRGYSIFSE
ncbi:unnamed protein product [Pieris brassicae]|uniref:Uncharacterized protein n=1 Tax=Pieris brassicae TaxID=7116 RepID=A0A9P0SV68_PIEBR|nr:unnamed protein product [Pieris brassicae]